MKGMRVALRLGRVSNLPTVWTNVLAGTVLAGGAPGTWTTLLLVVVATGLYVGGMYLNDAFDAEIDARERPERPIPAGEVTRSTVMRAGFAMLVGSVGLTVLAAAAGVGGWKMVAAATTTAGLVLVYDRWHKQNPASPLLMGSCRVGVYVLSAYAVCDHLSRPVVLGALLLLGYVLGLTYAAKHEASGTLSRKWPLLGLFAPVAFMLPAAAGTLGLWTVVGAFVIWLVRSLSLLDDGKIPAAVGAMIAGIALFDAMLIARYGSPMWTIGAITAFGGTISLQRRIAGT